VRGSYSQTSGAADVIIDGETGFIVPIGDVDILRDRIAQLVEQVDLRSRLCDNARMRALEFFTSEHMVTQTLTTYERALEQ
jgi:L-malate glycosyltransferase